MSNSKSSSSVSTGIASAGFIVSGLCLATSITQFGMFVHETMGEGMLKVMMIMGVASALIGSQVLIMTLSQAIRAKMPPFIILVALSVVVFTELASISTSQLSFNGNMLTATQSQNYESPQAQQLARNIARTERSIESLQATLNGMPGDWGQRRREVVQDIATAERRLNQYQRELNSLDVSTTAQAFRELPFGLNQSNLAFGIGVLMSAIPISLSMLFGAMAWRGTVASSVKRSTAKGSAPEKKHRAAILKAVR